ncbi:ubiquitin carboxyl-terminal hydrolase 20-like [Lineus longissimus]|uniref:ubiquitin carboxyl-terminal hydrolase 20-like n=1 Tax=Lineus longissimus TaxID=88925 RepID=UPI002B4D1E58
MSACPHIVTNSDVTWRDIATKKESSQCQACGVAGPNLWLCLKSGCFYVGCGESAEDHSSTHADETGHCVTLNLTTQRIWCYTCETEVFPGRNNPPFVIKDNHMLASESSPLRGRVTISQHHHEESDTDDEDENKKPRGLTGLNNIGNTCYMNAALQALSNCPPLTQFFLDCPGFVRTDHKPMLSKSYLKLMREMWHKKRPSYVVPSSVAHGMKMVLPCTFRLNSQQDTQEFLRCFMDQIHEELKQIKNTMEATPEEDESEVIPDQPTERHSSPHKAMETNLMGPSDTEYETCDSGLSSERNSIEQGLAEESQDVLMEAGRIARVKPTIMANKNDRSESVSNGDTHGHTVISAETPSVMSVPDHAAGTGELASSVEKMEVKESGTEEKEIDESSSVESTSMQVDNIEGGSEPPQAEAKKVQKEASNFAHKRSNGDPPTVTEEAPRMPTEMTEFTDALSDLEMSPGQRRQQGIRSRQASESERLQQRMAAKQGKGIHEKQGGKKKFPEHVSVISDIFDGKINSSVQCLTCERISSTKETFQDVSLPIPTKDHLHMIHASHVNTTMKGTCGEVNLQQGWFAWMYTWMKSWFWGPLITLQDCLAAFFSADELKGDNMYSCEKCKKLRNGVKYSKVLELPEILCIHLKRFRHEFTSSKISSYVQFPLEGLDMGPYLHKECTSTVTNYELIAVICHHGNVGVGHYIAYCLNALSDQWYEFDDQYVTRVDEQTVESAEAYVLFYRKRNDNMIPLRQQAMELMEDKEESLMQFFISRQWINRFNTFAEPGPITNEDFLCKHGGVPPAQVSYVDDMVTAVSQPVWEFLHETFGGGPAVNHLYQCVTCQTELEKLKKRQKHEMDTFIRLNAEFKDEENPNVIYAISMTWFKEWENFVRGKVDGPPPAIDNAKIAYVKNGISFLRTNSDYGQLSEEMWQFLFEIYGGGPELVYKENSAAVESKPLEAGDGAKMGESPKV